MSEQIDKEQWVWVLIQDPGGNEKFLGHYDSKKDVSYIPIFLTKEDALKGFHIVTQNDTHKYEAQAILFEDLCGQATDNGFKIYLLNDAGEIIEKIGP